MASVSSDPGGRKRILFIGADGKRRAIRLGKYSKKAADRICTYVESLAGSARARGPWEPETADWVGKLESVLYNKLAAVCLVPTREPTPDAKPQDMKLGTFLDAYLDSRTDIKARTLQSFRQVTGWLTEYFGSDQPLATVTPGDADDWRRWLLSSEKGCPDLGENTARRHCGRAKQFFRAAVRKRIIAENPFGEMRDCNVRANRERDYFVTLDEAAKVLDACPDAEWRLIFALSRFGGLRCPSEHLLLTWDDVDWEQSRITVHSPKTEHHEGKETRIIPIFPELRPHLEAVFNEAESRLSRPPSGSDHVIARYRSANANLRTQLERFIKRAGLKPWPKLFQNLRATRETELAQSYPMHVVCAWIGNSEAIAAKHYLQVTDEHFKQATEGGAESGALSVKTPAQNPAQPISAIVRHQTTKGPNPQDGLGLRPFVAEYGESWQDRKAAPV